MVDEVGEQSFPVPYKYMLDIWLVLGGSSREFDVWVYDPQRTPADSWAQLMAAIADNLYSLLADTNPPAGKVLIEMVKLRRIMDGFRQRFRVIGSDNVEVAAARFETKESAENLARAMNGLKENWDEMTCKPPYRVQEIQEVIWKDV